MADATPVVHIGENSPEHVAYKLLSSVAFAEGKSVFGLFASKDPADRKWILDSYAECLEATKGLRDISG
jgi:hypothetical protein